MLSINVIYLALMGLTFGLIGFLGILKDVRNKAKNEVLLVN